MGGLPVLCQSLGPADLEREVLRIIKKNPQALVDAIAAYEFDKQSAEIAQHWRDSMDKRIVFNLTDVPTIGPPNAPLTLVEVADFQCRSCSYAQVGVRTILERYEGRVKLAFINLPLNYHPQSQEAALSAWAASKQGKFFEYAERLFSLHGDIQPAVFQTIAKDLNLDQLRFEKDRHSHEGAAAIASDVRQAMQANVLGTPSFLVNGILVRGAIHIGEFDYIASALHLRAC